MPVADYRIHDLERAVQSFQYEISELKEEIFRLKQQLSDLERRVP